MTTPQRTFLTLGPAGMSLEWSDEDALEPDHLASSPAPSPTMPPAPGLSPARALSAKLDALKAELAEGFNAPATFAGIPFPPCERIVVGSVGSIGCGTLAPIVPCRLRPGQWGARARRRRARRLDRAAERRERERARREQGRKPG